MRVRRPAGRPAATWFTVSAFGAWASRTAACGHPSRQSAGYLESRLPGSGRAASAVFAQRSTRGDSRSASGNPTAEHCHALRRHTGRLAKASQQNIQRRLGAAPRRASRDAPRWRLDYPAQGSANTQLGTNSSGWAVPTRDRPGRRRCARKAGCRAEDARCTDCAAAWRRSPAFAATARARRQRTSADMAGRLGVGPKGDCPVATPAAEQVATAVARSAAARGVFRVADRVASGEPHGHDGAARSDAMPRPGLHTGAGALERPAVRLACVQAPGCPWRLGRRQTSHLTSDSGDHGVLLCKGPPNELPCRSVMAAGSAPNGRAEPRRAGWKCVGWSRRPTL